MRDGGRSARRSRPRDRPLSDRPADVPGGSRDHCPADRPRRRTVSALGAHRLGTRRCTEGTRRPLSLWRGVRRVPRLRCTALRPVRACPVRGLPLAALSGRPRGSASSGERTDTRAGPSRPRPLRLTPPTRRAEDRIRCLSDTGLRNLPFYGYAQNRIWIEVVPLAADLLAWPRHWPSNETEPARRCDSGSGPRVAGRIIRTGR